jgi:hypothetical protein
MKKDKIYIHTQHDRQQYTVGITLRFGSEAEKGKSLSHEEQKECYKPQVSGCQSDTPFLDT